MKPETSPVGKRFHQAGLTLLEMLVVLTITMALIVAAPWASFSGRDTVALKSLAREMAADMRRTRSTAIFTNGPSSFYLDTEKREFGREGDPKSRTFPEGVEVEFVTVRQDLVGASRGTVVFYPDGSSNGGTVTLRHDDREARIAVRWLTGQVTTSD